MKTFTFLLLLIFSLGVNSAPRGDDLYGRFCSSCHGIDGKGGVGIPIALPSFLNSVSDEYLRKTIRVGRPGRIMPAFNDLSDAQVNAVVKYVRSWSDKPAPAEDNSLVKGNSVHGKQLFAKNCVQCHGEDGRGGKGTGVTYSRKRDLPIIAPALNNAGFLASASDVMLRDTIAAGREGTPMPSMLAAGLSKADIDDVVSYIRSFEKPADKLKQTLNKSKDEPPIIVVDSPYDIDETVENLKQATLQYNVVLQSVRARTDAIWIPLDNVAPLDLLMPVILQAAWDKHITVFSNNILHASRGVLFALYPDTNKQGRRLVSVLRTHLENKKTVPQLYPSVDFKVAVNMRAAAHLEMNYSEDMVKTFDQVFPAYK